MATEIRRLLHEARATAANVVADHRAQLDRLADRLIRFETLEEAEIDQLLADFVPQTRPRAAVT